MVCSPISFFLFLNSVYDDNNNKNNGIRGVTRVGVTRGHICGVTPMKCNFFPYFPVSANSTAGEKKIIQIAVALLFFFFFFFFIIEDDIVRLRYNGERLIFLMV